MMCRPHLTQPRSNLKHMRPIKFRAWDKENQSWLNAPHWSYYMSWEGDRLLIGGNHIVEITQFTGLLDKNGKEIYEGDIVEYDWTPLAPQRGEVKFSEGMFCLIGGNRYMPSEKTREVVGNVWENPDLLSKERTH